MSSAKEDGSSTGKFGTFGGVFTPCTLTILGAVRVRVTRPREESYDEPSETVSQPPDPSTQAK